MWMIAGRFTGQVGWLDFRVGGHLALSMHSSNELGELSQWPCHDDSTINIVIGISISIISQKRQKADFVLSFVVITKNLLQNTQTFSP